MAMERGKDGSLLICGIIPVGAKVDMSGISCTVNSIMLRGTDPVVTYEVSWFDSGTRHEQWVGAHEVCPVDVCDVKSIGFQKSE